MTRNAFVPPGPACAARSPGFPERFFLRGGTGFISGGAARTVVIYGSA